MGLEHYIVMMSICPSLFWLRRTVFSLNRMYFSTLFACSQVIAYTLMASEGGSATPDTATDDRVISSGGLVAPIESLKLHQRIQVSVDHKVAIFDTTADIVR